MDETHRRILGALTNVYDPCCREKGVSLVDASRVLTEATERIEELADVDTAEVEVVWDTAVTTDRLSESARARPWSLPDPVAIADRGAYIAARIKKGAGMDVSATRTN